MKTQVYLIIRKQGRIQKILKISKGFVEFLLILFLILAISVKKLYARSSNPDIPVKGVVVDSISGEGISYVTIQIESNGNVVQRLASDASGNFSFTIGTQDTYDVILHSVGYQIKKTVLETKDSGTGFDLGKITLTPSSEQVKEVTVSALKPLVRSEAEKLVYNVESDPEATTSNALDMLRKVPLVSVDGEDNVQLRGISGVKILINGKTSSMLDQNAKEVLKSMSSNSIKDIEVITNPSSKYDAEGKAGIINIVTTRKTPDGFNGRLNAGVTSRKSYDGNLFFASKIQKFIYSVNLSLNHWNGENMHNENSRENFVSTTNRYSEKKWFGDGSSNWNTINSDASYEIDSLNLLSISIVGTLNEYENLGHTEVMDYDINHYPTMGFQNWFNSGGHYNFLSGNIDYQKLFRKKGNILTVSYRYDYSPSDRWSENNVLEILNFTGYQHKISSDMKNNEGTLQIDYVKKINEKHQIETGYKQIWRTSTSNSEYLIFDQDQNNWIQDTARINDLDYKQSVLSIYLMYDLKLKQTEIKAGLRGENTVNNGFFKSPDDTTFTTHMFNLVPYLLFSRNFEKGKSLKISYSERLARPGIALLNPFRNDADPQNIRIGNPNLETEVSHNFDFSLNQFSQKNNISLNLSGAYSGNLIVQNITVQPDGVRLYTLENIGNDLLFDVSIFGSSQLTKKLNLNTTIGANYHKINSNTNEGETYSGWNYNGKFDLTFKPCDNSTILVGAGGSSGSIYFQIKNRAYYWSYISYQQDLLKKKLKLEARLDNPFTKYQYFKSESFNKDFFDKYTYRDPSRILSIKLSYNFGTMKDQVKKAKTRIRNDDLKQGG